MTDSAGDWTESVWAHMLYVLLLGSLLVTVPSRVVTHVDGSTLLTIGVLGAWRYLWGLTHFVRSLLYRGIFFPRLRAKREAAMDGRRLPHAYLLVTSFRIPIDTTIKVYRDAFRAALAAPGGATIVASIVEVADQRLIKRIYELVVGDDSRVPLIFVICKGTGKRDALAYGFRAISRKDPHPDDLVALIDGDTSVPEDLVAKCMPFFTDPRVGALTTDELSEVHGGKIFHWWYSLRFAQRNILMGSMGLSQRVLTLTGRMSMYRASVIVDPGFIAQVEFDFIDHWRLGRFKFLTGDDKSTWFWLLKQGYHMLYVSDIVVRTVEDPPHANLLISSHLLMTRWFGNMLRNNSRALRLGPWQIGFFSWWTILDQRLSMWTTLSSVVFAVLSTLFVSPLTPLLYLCWVLTSRYVMTVILLSSRQRISIVYPFLIYFNQIYGSWVKTQVFFRLDKQKWTRQGTTATRRSAPLTARLKNFSSSYMFAFSWCLYVAAIATVMGLLKWPSTLGSAAKSLM